MEKKVFWNIPVPRLLNDAVEKAVIEDMHVTKSEFVRDAVRKELERLEAKEKETSKNER